jgi:hypothetical protein
VMLRRAQFARQPNRAGPLSLGDAPTLDVHRH